MSQAHVDVLIVGAGLSGIGAGYHLQDKCPEKSYLILESSDAIGIRSDSDMFTLGYAFRPWVEAKAIADGPSILKYVRDTATEAGIDSKIRFRHRVIQASWSSVDAKWTVEAERTDAQSGQTETVSLTCRFLFMCSGYFDHAEGYTPEFPGLERFGGRLVHPQKWTEDIDYTDKRVVIIGSGATAVTLLPELAKKAAHVTMLQRSPTYMVSRPSVDEKANFLRRVLPAKVAYAINRWWRVLFTMYIFSVCRRRPEVAKKMIFAELQKEMGPDYDLATHFKPRYNPWEQRLCLVPDADLFNALKSGKASIATDTIATFTETGINLNSGVHLPADLVVSATGLNLVVLGGIKIFVDGKFMDMSKTTGYKGMMYTDVPNLASAFGYTNASWTLKVDLICGYVCRLLKHMDSNGLRQCTPHLNDPTVTPEPWVDFSSGYFQRTADKFPKQGSKPPWRLYQNYPLDILSLKFSSVEDGAMTFSK
jgi:monooxygenase